jgi:hypothetical protein
VNTPASVREHAKWESIAQRSLRSQRDEGWSTNALGWTLVASVWEHAYGESIAQRSRRSQRDEGWSTNALGWTLVASVREHAYGEGIAQRSRRSQRGEVGRRMRLGERRGFCGRRRGGTEAAHAERCGVEIFLANLYGFNRISNLYADSHIRQVPIANS